MTMTPWPGDVPAVKFRIVKPTDRWDEVLAFYEQGVGLQKLEEFTGHQGYDGVMLGLPGMSHHLEIVRREGGPPNPNPHRDNLLVFYVPDPIVIARIVARLAALGYPTAPAQNPWWGEHGASCVYDPDGWGVIFDPVQGENPSSGQG